MPNREVICVKDIYIWYGNAPTEYLFRKGRKYKIKSGNYVISENSSSLPLEKYKDRLLLFPEEYRNYQIDQVLNSK